MQVFSSCPQMWSIAVAVLVVTGSVSCDTSCPDGKVCPDQSSVQSDVVPDSPLSPQVQSDVVPDSPLSPQVQSDVVPDSPLSPQVQSDVVPVQSDDTAVDSSPYPFCDSSSYCPAGTKCCRHPAGFWTCCSYSNGVCCRDGLHCCPSGSRCSLSSMTCLRSDGLSYPFAQKQESLMIKATKITNPVNQVDDQVQSDVVPDFPLSPQVQSDVVPDSPLSPQAFGPAAHIPMASAVGMGYTAVPPVLDVASPP
ncbi:hypothetical protein DPEC_G00319010 [Dallia pectoralis]|uniref:Uncharacterized protein n=1 Tax=Dallia pectoralis TaxID=75939 RepID=A0ACC2F9J6_DALPE|nr:hypothetical protein DPEC_G00319010 [Dallia pectoralis]